MITVVSEKVSKAYQSWQALAMRGYGERCNTPDAMRRCDERIRKAKTKYESLLQSARIQKTLETGNDCTR